MRIVQLLVLVTFIYDVYRCRRSWTVTGVGLLLVAVLLCFYVFERTPDEGPVFSLIQHAHT